MPRTTAPPLLIAGGNGTLGRALAAACRHRGIAHVALGRAALDVLDDRSVAAMLDRHRPWAVVNATGWARVDAAEAQEEACMAINAEGAARIAAGCAARDIQSVHFSSDLVFDGRLGRAYDEGDAPSPINACGRSKAAAERRIGRLGGSHLVVRTAAFFSPFDLDNFAVRACDAFAHGERFGASEVEVVSPTYVPDLCDAILDLAIDGERGLWHLTNDDACSWADFARRLAVAAGFDAHLVAPCEGEGPRSRAPHPRHVPLTTRRGRLLPPLAEAIARFARERR